MIDIHNKKVLVIGLGKTGYAVCNFLLNKGVSVLVNEKKDSAFNSSLIKDYPTKKNNLQVIVGHHDIDPQEYGIDLIIKSPGVPMNIKPLQLAAKNGTLVLSEIELAYYFIYTPIIGITGTNGKTTTTALTAEIFRTGGRKVILAGNIGTPLIGEVEDAAKDSLFVVELSSFQLETTLKFKPYISTVLNVTEDHIDYHHTLDSYIKAKEKIFMNQDVNGYTVLNADDNTCIEMMKKTKANIVCFSRKIELKNGVYLAGEKIVYNIDDEYGEICGVNEVNLKGLHNLENVMAATAISLCGKVPVKNIAQVLATFKGVPHRLEFVRSIKGVAFYNDSKGTNIEATQKAIDSFEERLILIAGGMDKGADFLPLAHYIRKRKIFVFLLGETRKKIAQALEAINYRDFDIVENLDEAVTSSYKLANSGDVVLLSPACASWDMYSSFEERGNHFKSIVESL